MKWLIVKKANKLNKQAKTNLNTLIHVIDKMWYNHSDIKIISLGNWAIDFIGYNVGYVISYKNNDLFYITDDNQFITLKQEAEVKRLTGYSYDEIYEYLKNNYRDLRNLKK